MRWFVAAPNPATASAPSDGVQVRPRTESVGAQNDWQDTLAFSDDRGIERGGAEKDRIVPRDFRSARDGKNRRVDFADEQNDADGPFDVPEV